MLGMLCTSSGVAITPEMLSPITDSITSNIGVILPVGVAIFGILTGISLVPKIIAMFKNHGTKNG